MKGILAIIEVGVLAVSVLTIQNVERIENNTVKDNDTEIVAVVNKERKAALLRERIVNNSVIIKSSKYLNFTDNTVENSYNNIDDMQPDTIIDSLWLSDIEYVSESGGTEVYRINSIDEQPIFDGEVSVCYSNNDTELQYVIQTMNGEIHRKVIIENEK